ncbi:taste receptor type 2 member 14-like [Ictidomys tridecemlineatus]|uniref:taste receptor type 2 member 14-like n=1 Tax=Ictidomys tridecemlineatus TaxID=43179 RepID=UPI000B546CFB|nr:taste receptor type 2 member 14-like [Ictidomys tridecemlineatus]KAG3292386.1 taste receptor type 2 member 14-like [Ictidomys tridecemlineatus]
MNALRNFQHYNRNWDILLQTMNLIILRTLEIILGVEFIIGTLGNAFIALVNCMDWIKRRKISLADQILTALALSRIGVLWSIIIALVISLQNQDLWMTEKIIRTINLSWTVTNHFSLWLASSLGIFYFLKIANFSNSAFLYLKWRVKKVVSMTLLVSLVLLFFNTVLVNTQIDAWVCGYKGNLSYSFCSRKFERLSRISVIINTVFLSAPFTVSLVTFLLLIFSLWKHLKRMQHSAKGSRDASTMAHVKALQTVIAFLLLYAIYFLSLVKFWVSQFGTKSVIVLFCLAAGIVFPSGHPFVLILGNSKLRQAALSVLGRLKCRFKDVDP